MLNNYLQADEIPIPLTSRSTFTIPHIGLKRIGEVADRSLYPCLPRVDTNATV